MDAAAIILAGGRSRRMGRNKALLDWHGTPLIAHIVRQLQPHFPEMLISAATQDEYLFLGLPVVLDEAPDRGPLMGLSRALEGSGHPWNFVVACDMPVLPIHHVNALYAQRDETDCVVARMEGGPREPLFAFYHQRLAPVCREHLATGQRSLQGLLDACRCREILLPAGSLITINTPDEYILCHGQITRSA